MSNGRVDEVRRASGNPWRRWSPWLAVFALVLAGMLHGSTEISPVGLAVKVDGGPPQPATFPYLSNVPAHTVIEFAFTVRRGPLTARSVIFVPDDHFAALYVNGQEVSLESIPPRRRDDYNRGFRFPLGAYLRSGDNTVVARVQNSGGPGGLDIRADVADWTNVAEMIGAAAALLFLAVATMRRFAFDWSIAGLYAAGLAVRLAYLWVTPFSLRNHDGDGHIAYIEYILRHRSLPGPYDGWVFYHPPLYYVLAALWWRAIEFFGVTSHYTILRALQLQAMLYELGFVAFGILTIDLWIRHLPPSSFGRRLVSRSALRALCVALLCFWPSAVVHSARIANDDPLYLCFGAAFYFVSRWWLSGRDGDLNWAAAWAALGMVTKTNALLLFVVLACLFAVKLVSDPQRRLAAYARRALLPSVLFLVSSGLALGRALLDTLGGRRGNLLVGNADRLPASLLVANGAANYLWFDLKSFVTQPFVDFGRDDSGREFFWNYALKTSLFGQFDFPSVPLSNLAVWMSFLLLVIVGCFLLGMAATPRGGWLEDLPATGTVAALVLGLAALRVSKPALSSNDFRYILPILAPFLYLYGHAVVRFCERGWSRLAIAGAIGGWCFVGSSAIFFAVLVAQG